MHLNKHNTGFVRTGVIGIEKYRVVHIRPYAGSMKAKKWTALSFFFGNIFLHVPIISGKR